MENSFFILSNKRDVVLTRLHFCTWDLAPQKTSMELGIEIAPPFSASSELEDLKIYFCAPWLNNKCQIKSLHDRFEDNGNCRFIFNETLDEFSPIDRDTRNGILLHFSCGRSIAVLPADFSIEESKLIFYVTKTQKIPVDVPLYIRVLIKTNRETFALIKNGITQKNYIFDFKINERRNLPDNIFQLKKNKYLDFCRINKVFCLHAISSDCEISFIDSQKLKNVRKLETNAFSKYLNDLQKISDNNYIITFCKDEEKSSYSFFSVFKKEIIGTPQILFAIVANIVCSLLFAIGSFRITYQNDSPWYYQLPPEYILAVVIVIVIFSFIIINRKFVK